MAKTKLDKTEIMTEKQRNALYAKQDNKIMNAYKSVDKSMLTVASALAVIKSKKLYQVAGYKNIYDYAENRYGISRGSTSDCITIVADFGDSETGEINEQWKDYNFTQLRCIRALPENKITEISPEMSTRDIKALMPPKEKESIRDESLANENQSSDISDNTGAEEYVEATAPIHTEIYVDTPEDFQANAEYYIREIYKLLCAGEKVTITSQA